MITFLWEKTAFETRRSQGVRANGDDGIASCGPRQTGGRDAARHAFRGHKIRKTVEILALGGRSFIQQKVEMDASTAAVIASNSGDTAGAACFKALEPVVGRAPTAFY
jgi:hypothetical protein